MEPDDLFIEFGLLDDLLEFDHCPLQKEIIEQGIIVLPRIANVYRPMRTGTELHRAIRRNDQCVLDSLLNIYQVDFDKIKNYLRTKYNWDIVDKIWLKKVNLIAIDEEQCKKCKVLEQKSSKTNNLKDAIFIVLKCPIDDEEVAVIHPNENNRYELFQLVQSILPNGILSWNYSQSNEPYETFIETAASSGRTETIKRLLELGADLNFPDHNPLLSACLSHQNDTIRWLLDEYFDYFDCTERNSHQMNAFLILMQRNNVKIMDFVLMKMISYRQKYYHETESEAFNNIFHFENEDLACLSGLTYLKKGPMHKKIEGYIVKYKLDLSYHWKNVSILVCLLYRKIALDYCWEEIRKNPKLLGIIVHGDTTVLHECIRFGMLDILYEIYERHPNTKQYFETDKAYGCLNEVLYTKHKESIIFILKNHASFFTSNLERLKEDVVLGEWRDSSFYHSFGELLSEHFPMLADEIWEAKRREPKFYPGNDLQQAFNHFDLEFSEFNILCKDPLLELSTIKGVNDITLLHYAVDKDNTALFINLLEAGIDIDAVDNEGNHAIHYIQSIEMLLLIIGKHCDGQSLVHRTNFEGYSVLHKVSSLRMEDEKLVALLEKVIELGADVNQLTKNGESAVFFVYSHTVLDVLIQYNVNLEVVNNAGETALDCHLQNRNNWIAPYLLSLTHDRAFFKNHAHKCLEPFMYLNRDFFSCDYQPILEAYPKTTKLIFDSVYNHSRELASRLFCNACGSAHIFLTEKFLEFNYDLDYNYTDDNGYTPIIGLLSYMEEPNVHLVRKLLKKGVNLEIRNNCERTALLSLTNGFQTAKWYGHDVESVKLLLDYGAQISSTDEDGNSALHYAFRDHEWELADLLLKRGADLSTRNKANQIPLHMASKMNAQLFRFLQ